MREESKSNKSSSLPRGLQKKGKGKKKSKGVNQETNGPRRSSNGSQEEYDEEESRNHSESDEAVDDRGAAFQRRNDPNQYGFNLQNQNKSKKVAKQRTSSNEDNEIEHTESEEGNNQDNPNFDGNERMFNNARNKQLNNKARTGAGASL